MLRTFKIKFLIISESSTILKLITLILGSTSKLSFLSFFLLKKSESSL